MHEQEFKQINERLDRMEKLLKTRQKKNEEVFFDNAEFITIMNISKKTSFLWRKKKIIAYSQINGKCFYRLSDIHEMLNRHRHPASPNKLLP